MNMNRILTLLALSAFVVGAVATPALAHAGDDRAAHHREAAEQHRELRDEHRGGHDVVAEFCSDEDNLTEREQERCDRIRSAHEPGHEARRAGHALVKAIDAHYARVGKLEMKEYEIEQQLADGNLSANETERLEHALVVIEAQQNKTLDRIAHLEERLDALEQKWVEVKEHVLEQRAKRGDDHEDCTAEKQEELAEADAELAEELAEADADRNETLAEAAEERDAVLSDPNSTEEDRAEAEVEYNATVEEADAEHAEEVAEARAEHDEAIAEIEAEHQECLADASEDDDESDDEDASDDDSQEEPEDESEEESEDESDDDA